MIELFVTTHLVSIYWSGICTGNDIFEDLDAVNISFTNDP